MKARHVFLMTAAACAACVALMPAHRALGAERDEAVRDSIRQLKGVHSTLLTDLPADPEVDALPGYFDQAFGQWCAYFGVEAAEHADWHVRIHLMKRRDHFAAAGMIPHDLPAFLGGYTRGGEIWLNEQPGVYYRRHLMLHEGTHAFATALAGGLGPPWFAEAVAELLATHRLQRDTIELKWFPDRREDVPGWGRIEIVQDDYAARRAMSLVKIMGYEGRAFLARDPYGWSWAIAAFLDGHPRYRDRFRQLHRKAEDENFNDLFRQLFVSDWQRLNDDWRLFVANVDYGYDFARMELEIIDGKPLSDQGATVSVAAGRGWQSSQARVEAGRTYRLRASGRFQVASGQRAWECEAGGVTIHYCQGRPLGVLLAAVRGDDDGNDGLLHPMVVGLGTTFRAARSGTLYFRINESAGRLADNSGTLEVEIAAE